ncbi:MAG TPA: phosphotransferase [Thermoanaerobaculia bacterium]|nr:phosphotransferase [Thermoanaerobaculia bacterium]
MLNVDNAAEYLIERGLMSVDSILSGDLIISSAARRNRNLRIKRKEDASYLVKQPDDPSGGAFQTLRAEAAFYSFCFEEAEAEPMRAYLPRLRFFDPERSLVVLDLLEGAVPLWQHPQRDEASRLVGTALATFHRTFRGTTNPRLAWLHRQTPWVMRVHKPSPDLLASLSPANVETLRILQTQEQISKHLDALRKQWRVETVIHNDIKSDNILVGGWRLAVGGGPPATHDASPRVGGGPPTTDNRQPPTDVALVDWELVQLGDPAWDIAGLLQDFILLWVTSMTVTPGATTEMLAASARLPLAELQRAIRAFWKSYRAAAELPPEGAARLITRAVAFSAARLIQSAYEMGAVTPALAPASVLLLQVSANLLRDPEAGQVQLYGLIQGYVPV